MDTYKFFLAVLALDLLFVLAVLVIIKLTREQVYMLSRRAMAMVMRVVRLLQNSHPADNAGKLMDKAFELITRFLDWLFNKFRPLL